MAVVLGKFERVNDLLLDLAQRDGIQGFCLDSSNCAALRLQNGVDLHFEWFEREQTLFVYSPIMRLPKEVTALRASLLEWFLRSNCLVSFGQFSLSPDGNTVLFQHGIRLENLTVRVLDTAIDQLLLNRQSMTQRLHTDFSTPLDIL